MKAQGYLTAEHHRSTLPLDPRPLNSLLTVSRPVHSFKVRQMDGQSLFVSYTSPSGRAGLALVGIFGIVSAVATFTLLIYFLICALPHLFHKLGISWAQDSGSTDRHRTQPAIYEGIYEFLSSTLGRYLVYLFICDCLQGVAFSINITWAQMSRIEEGTACTVQGALDQIGNLGAALWSLLIGFQTFCLLFLQIRPHQTIEICATFIVWSAVIIPPIVGPYAIQNSEHQFWSITGPWCYIGKGYKDLRLAYLYVWIFVNLACCLCMYSLIYLKFAGIIEYHPTLPLGQAFRWNGPGLRTLSTFQKQPSTPQSSELRTPAPIPQAVKVVGNDLVKVARRLMWYPLVYAIVIIPVAICRMGDLANWTPPFGFYIFAGVCYTCSGLSNTLLFFFTRHTFIQRRARTKAMHAARIEITIDVTHTSDLPLTPLPFDRERKANWDVKDLTGLEAPMPEPAISDLEAGKDEQSDTDAGEQRRSDELTAASFVASLEGYGRWVSRDRVVWDPSYGTAHSPSPRDR